MTKVLDTISYEKLLLTPLQMSMGQKVEIS